MVTEPVAHLAALPATGTVGNELMVMETLLVVADAQAPLVTTTL
jgi:hypothetical protein